MAVDLYVGSLTRFYTGQWENVVQKTAKERGLEYRAISPQLEKDGNIADPPTVELAARHWQQKISEALSSAGGSAVVWQEGLEPPFFTDRIGWDPLFAIRLWSACVELGKTPPRTIPDDMASNPMLVRCLENPERYELTSFVSAQFWLPADFVFFAKFPSITGGAVGVASIDALLFALEKINEQSWRTQEWRDWLKDEFSDHTLLETPAKYGFAVLASMAVEAKNNRLPMTLSF